MPLVAIRLQPGRKTRTPSLPTKACCSSSPRAATQRGESVTHPPGRVSKRTVVELRCDKKRTRHYIPPTGLTTAPVADVHKTRDLCPRRGRLSREHRKSDLSIERRCPPQKHPSEHDREGQDRRPYGGQETMRPARGGPNRQLFPATWFCSQH